MAIKRAWIEHAMGVSSYAKASASHRAAFTAGYLACQQAVAGELEHLEKAARHFYEAGVEMLEVEGFVPKPELKAWLERERLRRSKQEGSG